MASLKHSIKRILETLTGREVVRYGSRSLAVIDRADADAAWFSYDAQIAAVIARYDVNVVLDVGANEGQFASKLRTYYSGEIHSFEPVSTTFAALSKAASGDAQWHVHQLALGSAEATLPIHVSQHSVFSSLLPINSYATGQFGKDTHETRIEHVPVKRLDSVLARLFPDLSSKRILLKMDTQGYDLEVFKGLGSAVASVVALQSEVSLISIYEGMPHWTDSIGMYEAAGFGVVAMFPVTRDHGRVIEFDCLLSRTPTS